MPKALDIKGNPRGDRKTTLPAKINPEKLTKMRQPNYVTYMRAPFTINQYRVFITVLYHLQDRMEQFYNMQTDKAQLDLFQELGGEYQLGIPISSFGVKPPNYPSLKEDIKRMPGITVEMPSFVPGEKGTFLRITSLFREIFIPTEKYQKKIYFKFDSDTIQYLIDTKSLGFTKYALEIAMAIPRVYTLKMYTLISSWKDKGGFAMGDSELRFTLGIKAGLYPTIKNLYDNVIKKAYEDLFQKADVYFEVDVKPSAKDEKKIWKFKVISADQLLTPEQRQEYERSRDFIPVLIDQKLRVMIGEDYCLTTKDSSAIKLLCRFDLVNVLLDYVRVGLTEDLKKFLETNQENHRKLPYSSEVSKFIYRQIKRLISVYDADKKKSKKL